MLVQSILLAIWAGLCALDQFGPHLGFRKPLLASVGVGIIMGDLTTAIIIGATLELMWLGVNNIGAYVPPDVITGTVVGAALGIMAGGGTENSVAVAIAVGVPAAMLVQQLNMFIMTTNISLVHAADKAAESGDFKKLSKYHYVGGFMFFLSRAIPTFIACYAGSAVIENILAAIPKAILDGFGVAGVAIPAVGLAMLLTMMMKKSMWIFLIIGFVFSAYLNIPTLGIALIAAAIAGLYDLIVERKGEEAPNAASASEEGEYDL